MYGSTALLIARQVSRHGSAGIQHRKWAVISELLQVLDNVCLFIAFAAVAISTGSNPIVARIDVIIAIRVFFTVSALCGIVSGALFIVSMTRVRHG